MRNQVVVIGGGVAGSAAAIALGRSGRRVVLVERDPVVRHKVCGAFLSGEALEDLHLLGLDAAALGAVPIHQVRLATTRQAAEAPLPFDAASLTRKELDRALLAKARDVGVELMLGQSVERLQRHANGHWQLTLRNGDLLDTPDVFLATGKHDLRGHARPKDPHTWIAFKMYYRLRSAQTEALFGSSELMLYPGGYGGIQPVENGVANLCCVVQQKYLPRSGDRWQGLLNLMHQNCPHLAMRLDGAVPLLEKPIATTHIPYGYIRRTTEEGLYCIGDQAAVIPSFTGDGISLALHTARRAVTAYRSGKPAPLFQPELRSALLLQMRMAELAADGMNNKVARSILPFVLHRWPGVMRITAQLTRVAQRGVNTPELSPSVAASS